MTYEACIKAAEKRFLQAGIENAASDAEQLLTYLMDWDMTAYLMHRTDRIPDDRAAAYEALVSQREAHTPLQHLTGEAYFYGYPFRVNEHVLIPRFDTEALVYRVLSENTEKDLTVLDLCTGSGCIAAVLKKEGGYKTVDAADISAEALAVASDNAKRLGADIVFYESDLFSAIPGCYDLIVSNPPYIRRDDIRTLSSEVKDHDPFLALCGGEDGLSFYRRIVAEAGQYLNRGGRLYFETGEEETGDVGAMMAAAGFRDIAVFRDLSGYDRVVRGTYV